MAAHGRFSILRRCPVRLNLRRRVRPATGPPCPPCAILQHLNIGIWAYIPKCAKVAVGRRARLVAVVPSKILRPARYAQRAGELHEHDALSTRRRLPPAEFRKPCAIGGIHAVPCERTAPCCVYAVSYATDVSVPRTRDGAAQHIAILPHMPHVRSMPESARLHVDSTQPVNIILENAR